MPNKSIPVFLALDQNEDRFNNLLRMKECSKCLLKKEIQCFYKHPAYKGGLRNHCIDCCKENTKLYRNKNQEKITTYHKTYNSLNKDRKARIARNYRKNNKNAQIAQNLRTRVNKALINLQKAGSAISDLGCSILEFKIYLESKFQEGMTWENYGLKGWHIDHIIPLSSFNLTDPDEFKLAVHYTNLQPLWAKDNLKKGKKRTNAQNY